MSSDAILVLRTLFEVIWKLFTSWHIPGTRVTPAAWFFFVLGCVLALKVLKRIMLEDYNDERRGK